MKLYLVHYEYLKPFGFCLCFYSYLCLFFIKISIFCKCNCIIRCIILSWHIMKYNVVLYETMPLICNILHNTISYYKYMIQYHNFWYKGWFCELYHTYHTILHHMMLLYHILKWYTISDYIIQYRTTWYGTILYSTISCYMIQCNIMSYSTICCFMWYNT